MRMKEADREEIYGRNTNKRGKGGKMQVMDGSTWTLCEQLSGHHKRSSGSDIT
jgi:hypothetical protein